jgi:hypothetical protein
MSPFPFSSLLLSRIFSCANETKNQKNQIER